MVGEGEKNTNARGNTPLVALIASDDSTYRERFVVVVLVGRSQSFATVSDQASLPYLKPLPFHCFFLVS